MRFCKLIIFFICSAVALLQAQSTSDVPVQIVDPIRVEERIDIHDKANIPLFRDGGRASSVHTVNLVMDGLSKGLLTPVVIDPNTRTVKPLNHDQWVCRVQQQYEDKLKVWNPQKLYQINAEVYNSPRELCVYKGKVYALLKDCKNKQPALHLNTYWEPLKDNLLQGEAFGEIVLDITQGKTADQQIVKQVNYITFWDDPRYSVNGLSYPRFSLKWSDFINFLERYHKDKLYYTKAFHLWLGGDVFVTDNAYWTDVNFKGPFGFLPKTSFTFKEVASGAELSKDTLMKMYSEGQSEAIHVSKGQLKVRIEDKQFKPYIYTMPLNDYVKVLQDSSRPVQVYSLADAWRMQLFVYDESNKEDFPDQQAYEDSKTISKNAVLIGSEKPDALGSGPLRPSFIQKPTDVPRQYVLEELYDVWLNNTANRALLQGQVPLQTLLISYALSGKIKALNTYVDGVSLQPSEAKKGKHYHKIESLKDLMAKDGYYYDPKVAYKQGDTVRGDDYKFYRALVAVEGIPPSHESVASKIWEKIEAPLFGAAQLYLLQVHRERSFDNSFMKSTSEIHYIELALPAGECAKGIQLPMLVLDWKELKPLLLADPRANIHDGGAAHNYAELIEQGAYEGWFAKSGYLRAANLQK